MCRRRSQGTCEEKLVQRATEKLFLDALVIRAGKLQESVRVTWPPRFCRPASNPGGMRAQDKSLSAKEVQEMVRFGAQRIFEAKESSITDEDIVSAQRCGCR